VVDVVEEPDPVVDVVDPEVGEVVLVVSSDCEGDALVVVVVLVVVVLVVLVLVLDVVEVEDVEPVVEVVEVVPFVDVVEPEVLEVVVVVEQASVVDELDPVGDVLLEVVDVVELGVDEELELVVVVVSVDWVSAMSFSSWWREVPKGIARTSPVIPIVTEALMCQALICLIGHQLARIVARRKARGRRRPAHA
jgi:hypothetical protein